MGDGRSGSDYPSAGREQSERTSFRVALAIALLPIPASLLIAWALGDPPWRARPTRSTVEGAPIAHDRPGLPPAHSDH